MDSINGQMAKFPVLIDTNVLYKSYVRDLLFRLALQDTFRVRWSEDIVDELRKNLENRIGVKKTEDVLSAMNETFPDAIVSGYDHEGVQLTAKSDRHVVAAAVVGSCSVIITENLKDFPEAELCKYGLFAQHPDDFLIDHYDLEPVKTIKTIGQHIDSLSSPGFTFEEYIAMLERNNLIKFAQKLRDEGVGDLL